MVTSGGSGLARLDENGIATRIHFIRHQRVILDSDLAALYGVSTKRLNEQVKRNRDRFPIDFMFVLSRSEANSLRSQNATLKKGRGRHRKYLPYAFTEHGALMAANVLSSERAVEVSVFVVRALIRLREVLAGHKELAQKLAELEARLEGHDEAIRAIVVTIRRLLNPPVDGVRGRIGFRRRTKGP